jgi:ribosomal protein L7/L12
MSEALSSLKELPIVLAEGATLEQAQAFKGDLEEARARVEIIEE